MIERYKIFIFISISYDKFHIVITDIIIFIIGYSTNNTSAQEIPKTPDIKQNTIPSIKPTIFQSLPKSSGIQVNLTNTKIWSKFNDLTCEMIITKQGRRMFPTLQYGIDGLEPTKKYNVFVDIIPSEVTTMKFQAGKWIKSSTPASK